jgi:hypothetical protein
VYLAKLEKGSQTTPAIERATLDGYLGSHLIAPDLLRGDKFAEFMDDRQKRFLALIELATGKHAYSGPVPDEGEDVEDDDDAESGLTISAA